MSETDKPREDHTVEHDGPAGSRGSLRWIASIFGKEGSIRREDVLLKVTPCSLSDGSAASRCPQMNPLVALPNHAKQSMLPAAKSAPARIRV
jgi:hypothetical protein